MKRSHAMTNTINNVPRELLADLLGNDHDKRIMAERHLLAMLANAPSPAGVDADHVEDVRAMVADPSPAGVDGLEVVGWYRMDDRKAITPYPSVCATWHKMGVKVGAAYSDSAHAIIDGLRGEVARLREERDSFQRIGIRQIEHRYQLAALLLEKFPRIDPHHPITLSEVDHCCEYVLHKDRERLHCAIDSALSAVCAAAPNIATTSEHSGS